MRRNRRDEQRGDSFAFLFMLIGVGVIFFIIPILIGAR